MIDIPVGELSAQDARDLAAQLPGRLGSRAGDGDRPGGGREPVLRRGVGQEPLPGRRVGRCRGTARPALSRKRIRHCRNTRTESSKWLRSRAARSDRISSAGRTTRAVSHAAQLLLRAQRLLRGTGLAGDDLVSPYHDRVREAVLAHVSEDTSGGTTGDWLWRWRGAGEADAEFLAVHFHGAGDNPAAGRYYAAAARAAAEKTAFDQAARLYGLAADLGDWWPGRPPSSGAGRTVPRWPTPGGACRTTEAYLAAASGAAEDEAIESRSPGRRTVPDERAHRRGGVRPPGSAGRRGHVLPASQVCPPSSERKRPAGSTPAYSDPLAGVTCHADSRRQVLAVGQALTRVGPRRSKVLAAPDGLPVEGTAGRGQERAVLGIERHVLHGPAVAHRATRREAPPVGGRLPARTRPCACRPAHQKPLRHGRLLASSQHRGSHPPTGAALTFYARSGDVPLTGGEPSAAA